MCPTYITGLIDPGKRKSIQPMAARANDISYDRLHHFIGAGMWDASPLEAALWRHVDALLGGADAWLIIDHTAMPKKGKASVGVALQYASTLGKKFQPSEAGFHNTGARRGSVDAGFTSILAGELDER